MDSDTQNQSDVPVGYDYESDGWTNANHPFVYNQSMQPRSEVGSLFGQFDYDLTNNISLYSELMYSRRETTIDGYRQFWQPFAVGGMVPGFEGDMFLTLRRLLTTQVASRRLIIFVV